MSAPLFIHVMSNGDIWVANSEDFTPTGTITGTFRVNSDVTAQKLSTLSGTIGSSLAVTKATGKQGKEVV